MRGGRTLQRPFASILRRVGCDAGGRADIESEEDHSVSHAEERPTEISVFLFLEFSHETHRVYDLSRVVELIVNCMPVFRFSGSKLLG